MRNKIISSLAGAAFSFAASGLAFAADMPVKAPPPPPPAPVYSWTGWYVGGNVGGIWGGDPIDVSTTNLKFNDNFIPLGSDTAGASAQGSTGTFSGNTRGFIGGGQLGYNWQFTNWVAGFEADIQGVDDKINDGFGGTFFLPFSSANVTSNLSVTKELDYFGTVRGRLGWLAYPSLLVYGTGGLAYGGVKSSLSINQTLNINTLDDPFGFALNPSANGGMSQTRAGWTAGGGFEWMLAPFWSVKVEYLYYDLGSVTYNSVLASAINPPVLGENYFTNNVQTTTRFNGNIVRVGLNYHFN